MEKCESRICPVCGEIYAQSRPVITAHSLVDILMCCQNGHKWAEQYSLCYIGYAFNGKVFDSFGVEKGET